jgi:hypothetical protein
MVSKEGSRLHPSVKKVFSSFSKQDVVLCSTFKPAMERVKENAISTFF